MPRFAPVRARLYALAAVVALLTVTPKDPPAVSVEPQSHHPLGAVTAR